MDSLPKIWSELEEQAEDCPSAGILRRRIAMDMPHDFFVGLAMPARQRLFILEIDRGCVLHVAHLPKSRHFATSITDIDEYDSNRVCVIATLLDRSFSDIFSVLVEDSVVSLRGFDAADAAAQRLIERLDKWQSFFDRASPTGLSKLQQQGLVGELWFLKDVMLRVLGANNAVQSWKGPLGSCQDFLVADCAIEIKTIMSADSACVRISSELQLDDAGLARLFLSVVRLEDAQESGETLNSLVDGIRDILSTDATVQAAFDDRLLAAGYLEIHRHEYATRHYEFEELESFDVTRDFPRLIGASIPSAITEVQYSLHLAHIRRFRVSKTDLDNAIVRSEHA